jgi:hypothetical protein
MTVTTFGSRLHVRRVQKTVDVKVKTRQGNGQYTEANVAGLTNLTPTYEQRNAMEEHTDSGGLTNIVDVFFFERLLTTGILPAIREQHVIVDDDDVRYEVFEVSNEGGQGGRLMVKSRRLRNDT